MLHARMFGETPKFRDAHFQPMRGSLVSPPNTSSSPSSTPPIADPPTPKIDTAPIPFLDGNAQDRPLFAQFCANNPDELLSAARYVAPFCDAVDLNLGCPQGIARKGKYGAFLQEDQDLIYSLINKLHTELDVPVTAKIRILDTKEKTLAYAQKVLSAGASILTVHGRTRDMKGHKTGLADWKMIRFLRESLPKDTVLFANGNILRKEDIDRCLEETGADAVMSAEGNLYDPSIFADAPPVGEEGREYWRGKDGRGGWRMDAVFRRYMDIIYRQVLETSPPNRPTLYLPSDPEPAVVKSSQTEDVALGNSAKRKSSLANGEDPQPAAKRQKQTQKQNGKKEKTSSPNLLAMQPHLFKLLRPLVAKHHNVRDALARSRAGDIEAFENVLRLAEEACKEGLRAYEDTNGESWEVELANDARLNAAKISEVKQNGPNATGGNVKAEEKKEGADSSGGEEMDESSIETVRACKRPWWVVQPYVRPLPKEALAKGSLTLSKKEREALRRTGDPFVALPDTDVGDEKEEGVKGKVGGKEGKSYSIEVEATALVGHVEVERVSEGKSGEQVEVPKEGLVCG